MTAFALLKLKIVGILNKRLTPAAVFISSNTDDLRSVKLKKKSARPQKVSV